MFFKLKRFIQNTIGLAGGEANGFMVLIPLLFLFIFSEPLFRWFKSDQISLPVTQTIYLDSLVATIETSTRAEKKDSISTAGNPSSFSPFDPNVASLEELNAVGIPENISKRIIQYRTKGGSFRIKSDLAKMYGMDSSLYRKLYTFISLPEKLEKKIFVAEGKPVTEIQYDLNVADTSSFKSVRGIGSVLAMRIVKYRDGLGGFVSLTQLREVFGLDSLVIKDMNKFYIAENFAPRKIEINKATEKELDMHPYLSAREAKSIFTYRSQHGHYSSPADLLKIKTLSGSTVSKIAPYLSFE
jgi:competence protein ComEA